MSDKFITLLGNDDGKDDGKEMILIKKQRKSKPEIPIEPYIDNLRIIGKAGIGKSTYITKNYLYHDYLLVAFTGIAASQINGSTLSSTFCLGRFNDTEVDQAVKKMKRFKKRVEHLRLAKGMIIDEFYTVPSAIMSKVDTICQIFRESKLPFGGLQLILVGDDRQTECVEHAFVDTPLYENLKCKEIMLEEHKNMRLTPEYMSFCNTFRNPRLNRNKMLKLLKNTKFAQSEVKGYSVYYTNEEVNKKNNTEMAIAGGSNIFKNYKKNCPIYITNSQIGICNGVMGKLVDNKDGFLHIEIDDKVQEIKAYQITFVPGFAISIHKSQSKTWEGVNIYIKKEDLMRDRSKYIRLLYVAMTRVRHFDKCYIEIY